MPSVDPHDILGEVAPEEVPADAPPAAANYREADIIGVTCAECARFEYQGAFYENPNDPQSLIPKGVCTLWEANVHGDKVCDRYTEASPPMDINGNEMWDFADEAKNLAEVHLAGGEQRSEGEYVIKEILRTGDWDVIPTSGGFLRKPLKIVRDGQSDSSEGIIALSEIVENFNNGAVQNVQIPLSDDNNDHKNNTRVNTGYVRDIWISDDGEQSKLVAKMEFTEPDVKEKVLRGTYSDVSCGIPFNIISRGKKFGATLEHVAITNRPFIDGLGPFLAASDTPTEQVEVTHFSIGDKEPVEEDIPEAHTEPISANTAIQFGNSALSSQLGLGGSYSVVDVTLSSPSNGTFYVTDKTSETSWTAPFVVVNGDNGVNGVQLAEIKQWTANTTDEGEEEALVEKSTAPRKLSNLDDLEAARYFREVRFSEPVTTNEENDMSLNREELDRLDLSDEQRAAFQKILDEKVELSARVREASAAERISELEEMGFKEKPGFPKLYRDVMLSDDGGPAIILLSDEGKEKQQMTALEILDSAIEALQVEGKVTLSDQALVSGNDEKPPAEEIPVEDRVAGAREALGLRK